MFVYICQCDLHRESPEKEIHTHAHTVAQKKNRWTRGRERSSHVDGCHTHEIRIKVQILLSKCAQTHSYKPHKFRTHSFDTYIQSI